MPLSTRGRWPRGGMESTESAAWVTSAEGYRPGSTSLSGSASGGSAREWVTRLRDAAPNERAQTFVTALAVEPLRRHDEPDAKYADIELAKVGELAVSREITVVKSRLQRINPVEEQAGYNRIFGDLVALETRRRALLDRASGV